MALKLDKAMMDQDNLTEYANAGTKDPSAMVAHWVPTTSEMPKVKTFTHGPAHTDLGKSNTHPVTTRRSKLKTYQLTKELKRLHLDWLSGKIPHLEKMAMGLTL